MFLGGADTGGFTKMTPSKENSKAKQIDSPQVIPSPKSRETNHLVQVVFHNLALLILNCGLFEISQKYLFEIDIITIL